MADEDEIDVLGDFSLDILSKNDTNIFDSTSLESQSGDLLHCDYTSQWLLDRPNGNSALWYEDSDLDIGKQFEYATSSAEPQISTENSITDESGWTEKEKNLLHRGIEIFGKSSINLSQFIGSRTPAEVKYFLKNFYSDVQLAYTSLSEDVIFDNATIETAEEIVEPSGNDILDDNEIPASIEEVIAVVSTAKPTLVTNRKRNNSGKNPEPVINYENIASGQSLLKSSYFKNDMNNEVQTHHSNLRAKHKKSVKFKFKTNMKLNVKTGNNKKNNLKKSVMKRRRSTKSESEPIKTELKDIQIVTGNGLAVPVCKGEEVIKIQKEHEIENSDSDIEIDVEDINDDTDTITTISSESNITTQSQNISLNQKETVKTENAENVVDMLNKTIPKKMPTLEELDATSINKLTSMEYPSEEVNLKNLEITDVEKFIFFEFFEGRPTKTPMRYLRIRNHILNTWNSSKPHYVTKTSIRNGLRQCGDVNCIGRIHNFLEQIGAINFGCEQTIYSRPLYDLLVQITPKEKHHPIQHPQPTQKIDSTPRQRIKKKIYVNDGEGGCTLTHDETGVIINTTVVNEEPAVKQRSYVKKPSIRLIYCRSFNDHKPQEYMIKIDLSALILMDLHAHMYLTEVMGLIGGHWYPERRKLFITRYIPCKNIAPSTTHCDMCPITQARAADILHGEKLDILGWFHSHPTFAPEPSQQDLDTQLSVQQWIGANKPCIGFILSPFSLHGALIASPYRCLIVDKKENFEDQYVPYKFKVDIVTDELNIGRLLKESVKVVTYESNESGKNKIDFKKMYFQDNSITYLDKFIYSIKMHLAKCSKINKMTCDAIVDGLMDACGGNI